jgi:hypothetical protein
VIVLDFFCGDMDFIAVSYCCLWSFMCSCLLSYDVLQI